MPRGWPLSRSWPARRRATACVRFTFYDQRREASCSITPRALRCLPRLAMPLDALAGRLAELLERGSLTGAYLSEKMRARLETLFRIGALVYVKAGGGKRIELRDREAVDRWIASNYPSGLSGTISVLPPRAEAAANFGDTKSGRSLESTLVFVRGFGKARLIRDEVEQPIGVMTSAFGVAGVVIDPQKPWDLVGTVGIVENLELFMRIEQVEASLDAALWTAGRLNSLVIDWLSRQRRLDVVHFGDFDPVGLDEYLRLRAALRERVRLFIPSDLEERMLKYGHRELLERSTSVLARVRRDADASVRVVVDLLDRHGLALEH